MNEQICDICVQRPAKLKCEDCNTYCCPTDVDEHKELLPDHPHHLIPLKSRSARSASLRSQQLQATQYTESEVHEEQKTSEKRKAYQRRKTPEKRKASENGKAPEKRRVISEPPSAPATYTVFESRVDIAQTFMLYKWMLNQNEAETLVQTLTALAKPIKVIGTYGPADTAIPFIRGVLKVTEEMLPPPEDTKEGILAYLRTDIYVLCFYFKIEKEDTYLQKPYPSSAREAVYLRLLFDLCPTVICCISEEIQRNWYTDSQLQNPFLPRIHRGLTVKVDRRKVQSSEIEEIRVVLPALWKRNSILTSDHFPYLFQTEVIVKDFSKQTQSAIDKFKTWLSHQNPTTSDWTSLSSSFFDNSRWTSFFSSSSDYDHDSFHAFSSAMKMFPGESVGVISIVKDKYACMKTAIKKDVENSFAKIFGRDFIATFELQNTYSEYLGLTTVTLDEFYAKLKKLYTESHKYRQLHTHAREARNFVLRHKEQPHLSKEELGQAVTSFFDDMEKTISAAIEASVNDRFSAFEAEITEIITNSASCSTEMCAIHTYSCSFTKDSVEIKDEEVENRLTLETRPSDMSLHVLDKEAVLAVVRNEDGGQTVKFNPSAAYTYEVEELKNVKTCALLASGSTVSQFVAFYNEEQHTIYGAAREMKGIDKGISLNVYGDLVRKVTSACILQKTQRLLLLNEEGTVFVIELASSGKCLTRVMVDRREERHSEDGVPLEPETVRTPLVPSNGSQFYDIKSSDDETLYFFLTDTAIEIYDLNYVMVKKIAVSSPRITYKILASGAYNVILTEEEGVLRAFRFQSETERVETQVVEAEREEVPGNPIIDILYYAFFKFGLRHPSERKPCFYLYSRKRNLQCRSYVKSISLLSQAFDLRDSITAASFPKFAARVVSKDPGLDAEDIKWRLLSRAPLHLCSIQDGNLIPLRDGLNNFEAFISQISESKTDFVTSFVSYIRLSGMEAIIKDAEELKVVAIIGRQSSGKSYLLNRLFGTRFDVAAHRCTDGIWLSVSRIQHQTFLVLDCEGLFSEERSVQEEIKLCLLLAAISDVTILNQDLSFNRNLSYIFQKFSFGIDRLKGEKLFKGRLEIAIRDVGANQDEGATAELRKFVMSNKANFLIKLFGGKYDCRYYHNFENEQLFEEEVVRRRQEYLEIPARWTSGEEFLMHLKTAMAHIYADDATCIDLRTFQLQLEKVSASVKKAIEIPVAAKELLSPFNPTIHIACSFGTYAFTFDLALFDLVPSLVSTHQVFTVYMEKFVPVEARLYEHNAWYQAVEGFMKAYFELYRAALFEYFDKCVSVTEEFRPIYEGERNILEHMFDDVILQSHTLCRRKCKFCDFCCVKPQNHSDNCDCSTSHKCLHRCSVCGNAEMCSQNAGHTGAHVCASKPHTCGLPCQLRGCKGTCTFAPNHGGSHRCSAALHPCGAKCSVFHMCKRTCEIDQMVEHSQHDCGQRSCPFPCELCRGEFISPCMSQNHLHFLSTDPEDISADTGQVLHFCGKEHPCSVDCEQEGVCDLQSVTEKRILVNEDNKYSYTYVSQKAVRLKCATHIPWKTIKHAEKHWCEREHKCDQTCPDCKAYCEQVFGHEGVHSTAAHRNKERCIYVAKSEGIESEIEEESKRTTRKLKAGESARPEFCDQSCVRKGRGHTHPIECPGGTNCLQAEYPGRAVHSKDKYYPDLERVYDLVACELYWRLKGWEPPVLKKSLAAQRLFALCPFYCASPEHTQPVYCDEPLFHSNSLAYKDHQFSCSHRSSSVLDIVFVLDCTSSMGSSFPQIKDVITQVINRYQETKLSNSFAIVGYTDHAPDHGNFPAHNPITVYPASRNLRDFEITAALEFLNSLKVSGGGQQHGEAMLDGMNAANSLFYRDRANRLVFIIGDDCPHGEDFATGTTYPEGCPCGLKWKALLKTMKTHHAEIRFVNLSSITNKTADLFKAEYGEGFEVIPLASMAEISTAVVKSIVAVIEHNLEFALD